ncbi:hypothetical protein TNCV_1035211 [Trichonephila clavipes]|nr:hypothetical protein TNCV_1035211 [Trichonephila clavipes]
MTAVHTQAAPSLRVSMQGACLKDIWYRGAHYKCFQRHPPIDTSTWSGVAHDGIGLQWNGTISSSTTNLDSI